MMSCNPYSKSISTLSGFKWLVERILEIEKLDGIFDCCYHYASDCIIFDFKIKYKYLSINDSIFIKQTFPHEILNDIYNFITEIKMQIKMYFGGLWG